MFQQLENVKDKEDNYLLGKGNVRLREIILVYDTFPHHM